MDSASHTLFDEIDTLLRACGSESRACRAYWQENPTITAHEIEALMTLDEGPRTSCELAALLGREPAHAQRFLNGLIGIGLVERRGDLYAASEALVLYCRALRAGLFRAG